MIIAASLLSANWSQMADTAQRLAEAGVDRLHLDVMDGHYVPNLTFGPSICTALKDAGVTLPMDVHLMTTPVDATIDLIDPSACDIVYLHPETTHHLHRQLLRIRDMGCRTGLALNPTTPLTILDDCHHWLDEVLLMTVNPGFGGQSLVANSVERTNACRQRLDSLSWTGRIAVDGAITPAVIADFARAGVTHATVGSYLFRQPSLTEAMAALRQTLEEQA